MPETVNLERGDQSGLSPLIKKTAPHVEPFFLIEITQAAAAVI